MSEAEVVIEGTVESTPVAPTEPSYYLADGVSGEGEAPEWFKGDKYKSVADQAKAYSELSSKYAEKVGSFTGAPEAYEVAVEGIELSSDDPLLQDVQAWAKESNLSQEGFNGLVERFAQHQIAQQAAANQRAEAEIKQLENSDQRIADINDFLKANVGADYDALADAVTTAAGVRALEALIKKAGAKPTIAEGDSPQGASQAEIEKLMTEKDDSGKVIYRYSKERQEHVRSLMAQLHR